MALPAHTAVDLRSEGPQNGVLKLTISGRLDSTTTGRIWRRATTAVAGAKAKGVIVNASGIDYCDGAGIALMVYLRHLQSKAGRSFEIDGLRPEFATLLNDEGADVPTEPTGDRRLSQGLAEEIGEATVDVWRDIQVLVSFVGELTVALVGGAVDPPSMRGL